MQEANENNLLRNTKYGKVRGKAEGEALVWYNIPYGKEPSGALRWQPPQNPDEWEDVFDASVPGEDALQPSADWQSVIETEDCLNLDIYSPGGAGHFCEAGGAERFCSQEADEHLDDRGDSALLPVLVFLHGGNNQTGTSRELVGCHLAVQEKIVVVCINHRLGLFGFNCLPAVLAEENQSGNFALLDIAKALDWVKENIAQFGGDPENITLSGFSAGGRNVMAALISPLFKGKFHKAAVFSGGMTTAKPEESARRTAEFLAKLVVEDGIRETEEAAVRWLLCETEKIAAGDAGEKLSKDRKENKSVNVKETGEPENAGRVRDAGETCAEAEGAIEAQKNQVREYLYSLPSERIAGLIGGAGIRMSGFPHLFSDGITLPENGFDTEIYNDVPVMMLSGTTEFSMFALGDPFLLDPQMIQYSARYRLRAALFASRYGSRMYRYFNTDASAQRMAEHYQSPLYLCSVNYGNEDSPCSIPRMGAFHGIFLAMLYPETSAAENVPEGTFESASYRGMADVFCRYLKNFLYTGNPNELPDAKNSKQAIWPVWKSTDRISLVFDGVEDQGIAAVKYYDDSMEKILEDMEADTSIPEELKLLVIRNILNGRWFSEAVDRRYQKR